LYRRADAALVDEFLSGGKTVIVLDQLEQATALKADILLPAGTFAETDGTLVNNEGRAQRFYQVFVPDGDCQESWRWIRDLARACHRQDLNGMAGWRELDDIVRAISDTWPAFHRLTEVAPPAEYRPAGQRIPRQTFRVTGRTALRPLPMVDQPMHEPKPPDDPDSPLAFSMEGYQGQPPSPLINRYWAPGWNSVQSLNKFQSEVGGPLYEENPGIKLIEPSDPSVPQYFTTVPESFQPREGAWLILPLWRVFGSEELSAESQALTERIPTASLALHPGDARKLAVQAGGLLQLTVAGRPSRLPVRIDPSMPTGTAGLTMVEGWSNVQLPEWSVLTLA
jgi:NADH-quinone oxidoreductase subunit G